jgi:hypothetical protein
LQSEKSDSEAVYRALVGLGNVVSLIISDMRPSKSADHFCGQVHAAKKNNVPMESGQRHAIQQCIRTLPAATVAEDRIRGITEEMSRLLG